MKDLFGENEGEKIEMRTRLYTSTKKEKTRRKTELTDIDDIDLWRRANGVYELCQCMMSKPERGKSYHILTGGNVDLLSHLLWIMLHWPKIKRLFLSCWAISAADIMLLARKLEAKEISGLEILLGEIFPSKYKQEWAKLMEMYEAGVITDIYKSTIHSKVMLIEAEDGTKLVVESSANCNMNPRIEQSCITISEKLFDFYDVYLHEVLNDAEAKYTARETMKLMNDETDKIDNDERAALLRENGVGDEMGEPEEQPH